MLSVCRSYVGDVHHAEDCMIRAFVKVFKNVKSLKTPESLFPWIRRIMVNECLDFLRQNHEWLYLEETKPTAEPDDDREDLTGINAQELLDQLSDSQRAVFNLFVLEDFSHQEVAETLNITEAASKTQLMRAKGKLKEIILQQKEKRHER